MLEHLPDTPRSLIEEIRQGESDDSESALRGLCEQYAPAVYGMSRKLGLDEDGARDATQAFWEKLLGNRGRLVKNWKPEKGRFRDYLKICLRNEFSNGRRSAQTQKRGGRLKHLSFEVMEEVYLGLVAESDSPGLIFDRICAEAIVLKAVERLGDEMAARNKVVIFDLLKTTLSGSTPDYQKLAGTTGLSVETLRVVTHRMRKRFAELVRQEVRATLHANATQADLESELEALKEILVESRQ